MSEDAIRALTKQVTSTSDRIKNIRFLVSLRSIVGTRSRSTDWSIVDS